MNIFVLDLDPRVAAQHQCDKHVVKMVLESTQLLCTAYPVGIAPYKRTHYNHPCAIWTRESLENWQWLHSHAQALSEEYTLRYRKRHKCQTVIDWLGVHKPMLSKVPQTPFVQCMPKVYKDPDPVVAYRAYYCGDKQRIARWNKGRNPPHWYNQINGLHLQKTTEVN